MWQLRDSYREISHVIIVISWETRHVKIQLEWTIAIYLLYREKETKRFEVKLWHNVFRAIIHAAEIVNMHRYPCRIFICLAMRFMHKTIAKTRIE